MQPCRNVLLPALSPVWATRQCFASKATKMPALLSEIQKRLGNMGKGAVIGTAVGVEFLQATVCAVPVLLGAVGFTSGGIAAASLAAKWMSASAIANGGGVAAGSLVAGLQSVGAAGLAVGTKVGITATAASAGAAVGAFKKDGPTSS
ncbi:interferon alpha-inducible protein 27-like protein 2A isoform X1 [Varanus komodoensis]|uniref:interferon alpha-inducible protein 27-like protein 2A isoform X1 n=1 Tax=Varanus komodoensis TaxID=61221 RepID=UPI001CF7996B|nr:interferon alpha-inducible protein 27-like protein 2A isoform X1 [Varanus komodoensis]XP_044280615.1 interferon alpha-inducible protein 27-like protein 2A isoform X1 [Varanus komodoensis]